MKAYKRNMMLITVLVTGILFCTAASQAAAVNMTGWTLIVDPDPLFGNWKYSNPTPESGRMDETTGSGMVGLGWVVSNFVLPANSSFSMTLTVLELNEDESINTDDDFIGLAFCYQDNNHFYLLDWRRLTQTAYWGDSWVDNIGEQGIKLKKVDGSWTRDGLWGGTDGIGVSTLAGPVGGGWVFDTAYTFDVALSPGHILVALDGSPLFDVPDSTFQGGPIALYGFSQNNLLFSNVVPEPATLSLLGLGGFLLRRRKK